MKKLFSVMAAMQLVWVVMGVVTVPGKAYAAKEALWEEDFDKMEDGEETGLSPMSDLNIEVQGKIVSGDKGKALKISGKEGVDYSKKYNIIGIDKDLTFPNENAMLSFSYYASGIKGLGVMTNDRTIPENCDGAITGLVQNKWTKVALRVSKFKVKSAKGKIKDGDEFRHIWFMGSLDASKPANEQFYVLDDIKLTIGEDDAKDDKGEKKDEKAPAPAKKK